MVIKDLLKKIRLPKRNISESQNKGQNKSEDENESKNKVKNTKNNAKNNAISVYDTEAMYIPQYVELSEEEKKLVDNHEKEIDIENVEKIIFYAYETSQKANIATELILKILFRIREIPQQYVSKDMDVEEVYIRRLDAMIRQEQLKLHRETMQKLEKDITLQIIALERRYEKETKRKIDFLGVFKIQKKIRRNDQLSQLRNAIERTKIVKQTIGYQISAIDIEMKASKAEENIANKNNIFDISIYEERRQKAIILEQKVSKMRKIVSYLLPSQLDKLTTSEHEEEEMVVELANIQNVLDIYAYKHKKDISQKLSEAIKRLKTVKKEYVENEINKIQALHDAFEGYISSKEVEKWYRLKFKYILKKISIQGNKHHKQALVFVYDYPEYAAEEPIPYFSLRYTVEYEFYKKFVEEIVENIIKGKNRKFNELLGKEKNNAIKYIKKAIEQNSYSENTYSERILRDRDLLLLITSEEQARKIFLGDFTILTLEQLLNSEVIKKRGITAEMTDFSILLGGERTKSPRSARNECYWFTKNCTEKNGLYWTKLNNDKTKLNHYLRFNTFVIDGYGENFEYNMDRYCGARVALPFTSISNIPTNGRSESIKRAEDSVLEVEYGYYPQVVATKDIQYKLEKNYKSGKLLETKNYYTIYADRFEQECCIEYEYKGKRYIRLEMNSLSNENCNLCPKRFRCYTIDKVPLLDEKTYIKSEFVSYRKQDITSKKNEKTYIKGDFVWVEVTPIKWLIDEKLHMMITEKIMFVGVYTDEVYGSGNFEKTRIKKFMNAHFSRDIEQIVKESKLQIDFWQEEEYEHEI